MDLQATQQKFRDFVSEGTGAITTAGLIALNAIFPNDFEYYLMAFELEDVSNENAKLITRFIFPVNPKSYASTEDILTNVKKTSLGVASLTNNSFQPRKISIRGNFGRSFKLMIGETDSQRIIRDSIGGTSYQPTKTYSATIKTGYGV